MRWYGWGREGQGFDPVGRPNLWPYAKLHLDVGENRVRREPVALDRVKLPERLINASFESAVAALLPPERRSSGKLDRLLHAYGRSTRDLWRLRHGVVDYAPDLVVYPENESEIVALVTMADRHGVVLVPMGGGSNVAGCLERTEKDGRASVSVNLRRMNRVLAVDKIAGLVRVEAEILGPDLEAALEPHGLTLGHFPDSFPHSTLGGWVATRSSGMLSDRYGNIEDMVLSLRMVTPRGVVATNDIPHGSHGPEAKQSCIGSEGTLGIITELTMHVREMPPVRRYQGYLFRDFASGLEAIRATLRADCRPALSRLHDPDRTQLSAAFKPEGSALEKLVGFLVKSYLGSVAGFDLEGACLLIAGFEGSHRSVARERRMAGRIYRSFGAVPLGQGPGAAFAEGKFDFPYIRDFLMDYDIMVDVAETSTTWSKLRPLYGAAMDTFRRALAATGRKGWVGCHVSHSYHGGATLYFSFAFKCRVSDRRVRA